MNKTMISLSLCTSLALSGCIKTSTLSNEMRPQHWGTKLNQAHNFHQISSTVFRSEQPDQQLIPELKQHDIDVVINLRSRDQDQKNLGHTQLNLIHVPINTWAINRNHLLEVMQHIQQAKINNKKVLIHCYHGSDRTGANIAMYRIIFENWTTQDALTEMKHGGYGFHPIWINIEKNFKPENIKWIREQLSNPS